MIYNPNEIIEVPKIGMLKIGVPKISMPNVFGAVVRERKKDSGYIRDGLVFHLDGIDKGPNEDKWTDLVGGVVFTPDGDVIFNYDSVKGKLISDDLVTYLSTTSTIEICTKTAKENVAQLWFFNGATRSIVMGYSTETHGICITTSGAGIQYNYVPEKSKIYRISANNNTFVVNGSNPNAAKISQSWNANNLKALVNRTGTCDNIYSIRIYDRLLSEAEMRHNQAVDYERFLKDIGKTIIVTATSDSVNLKINGVQKTYPVTPNKASKIVVDESNIWKIDLRDSRYKNIDLSNFNMNNVTSIQMWCYFNKIESLNLENWDMNKLTNTYLAFSNTTNLKDLKFGYNLKASIYFSDCPLTHESALSVIDGLAEVTTPKTVTFKGSTYDTLTDAEIATAVAKGWNIVSASQSTLAMVPIASGEGG